MNTQTPQTGMPPLDVDATPRARGGALAPRLAVAALLLTILAVVGTQLIG